MRAISRHIWWMKKDFAFIFSFMGISDHKWPEKNIRHRFEKKRIHDPRETQKSCFLAMCHINLLVPRKHQFACPLDVTFFTLHSYTVEVQPTPRCFSICPSPGSINLLIPLIYRLAHPIDASIFPFLFSQARRYSRRRGSITGEWKLNRKR